MYTSQLYNPNLPRKACRVGVFIIVFLIIIEHTHCHEDTNSLPAVETLSGSMWNSVPRIKREEHAIPLAAETTTTTSESSTSSTPPTTTKKPIKRFEFASIEFHRVETPFIIGLWIFCASLAKIGFHMAPKLSEIFPESCLLIVVGVVIGVILVHVTDSVPVSPLTPSTFFFYMLPPIILDAGYFMPNRLFFDHLGTILLFAVVGTIFNTLTIGASLCAVESTKLFGEERIPPLDMFIFAALISAVDPVAVLAVFEEIHVNEILYIVVFGESLLNDAVTVVLYHMFESYSEMGYQNIITMDVVAGCGNFFVVAVGGTVIGVLWGFATGFVTRFTNEVRVIEPIFIFVMAYLAYLCAEIFHMSGILAITFCGITMKNYVEANISHKSHTTIKYTMKMLSSSSETIIFMFLGVATVNKNHTWNTWFVVLTIFFCSAYRTIGVIILTAIANRFRLHQLDKVEKFVMSYGGLRGAVAFALVRLINPDIVKRQPMFMTTTIAVVYFTVFFQGITIKPLVKILNVKTANKRKPTMNERIHEKLMDHLMAGVEDILGHHGNYHVRDRFKRFDNKYIRPYLLRNYQGQEPKILETYSKLAMRDAMEFMRRNASTIGNISGTESMSGIFKNYTPGHIDGSTSFTQLDNSNWNIDMQELEYNPSKKDLTDAKIHHLLAEELCQTKRHRRLSYSRHAVNDRDLTTQVNYKMHYNMRRLVGDNKHSRHHHKRHSKKIQKDGKQNHVSFPEFQQNGSAKQFSHDYINQVLSEEENMDPKSNREDWDSPITFTAKSSPSDEAPLSTGTEGSGGIRFDLLTRSKPPTSTSTAGYLPWRPDRFQCDVTDDSIIYSDKEKRTSRMSLDGGEMARVTTPTATETMLPWKRDDEDEFSAALQQSEFPAWASNKEYLAYNSPSATFLGGLENSRSSVIGLFRRDSIASGQISSCDSSPQKERRNSSGPNAVILIEDNDDPLGASAREASTSSQAPETPNQRRQIRRGSMLEITGSLTRDTIPEEVQNSSHRRPSWLPPPPRSSHKHRPKVKRHGSIDTTTTALMSPSPTISDDTSDEDEDVKSLMKAGF